MKSELQSRSLARVSRYTSVFRSLVYPRTFLAVFFFSSPRPFSNRLHPPSLAVQAA